MNPLACTAGYSKWNSGVLGWEIDTSSLATVTATVGDDYATITGLNPSTTASSLSYTPVKDATIGTIGTGRFLRVSPSPLHRCLAHSRTLNIFAEA